MTHPLVTQLRFARSEFVRGLQDVSAEDAVKRIGQMNCISWIIGHLASQENFFWVRMAQGETLFPDLNNLVGFGKPASMPPVAEMWAAWRKITETADRYLSGLTVEDMPRRYDWRSSPIAESVGTLLMRNIYHYWYHLGEGMSVRQALGHQDLPQYVGDMSAALYYPE